MGTVDDAMRFFSSLSGNLDVKLSEPTHAVSERLVNQVAPASAKLLAVELKMKVYENEKFRPLTDDEWNRVVLVEPTIRMRGESEVEVEHAAPNGAHFTVRDLTHAVEETERVSRASSEWLGGIDAHHVFFEGLERGEDGVWTICWGS